MFAAHLSQENRLQQQMMHRHTRSDGPRVTCPNAHSTTPEVAEQLARRQAAEGGQAAGPRDFLSEELARRRAASEEEALAQEASGVGRKVLSAIDAGWDEFRAGGGGAGERPGRQEGETGLHEKLALAFDAQSAELLLSAEIGCCSD